MQRIHRSDRLNKNLCSIYKWRQTQLRNFISSKNFKLVCKVVDTFQFKYNYLKNMEEKKFLEKTCVHKVLTIRVQFLTSCLQTRFFSEITESFERQKINQKINIGVNNMYLEDWVSLCFNVRKHSIVFIRLWLHSYDIYYRRQRRRQKSWTFLSCHIQVSLHLTVDTEAI